MSTSVRGASARPVELQARHGAVVAPLLQQLVEGVDARRVRTEEGAAPARRTFVVVIARRARLEERQAAHVEAVDQADPLVLGFVGGLDGGGAPALCLGDDVGDVARL